LAYLVVAALLAAGIVARAEPARKVTVGGTNLELAATIRAARGGWLAMFRGGAEREKGETFPLATAAGTLLVTVEDVSAGSARISWRRRDEYVAPPPIEEPVPPVNDAIRDPFRPVGWTRGEQKVGQLPPEPTPERGTTVLTVLGDQR
jgi:hypothetical protein